LADVARLPRPVGASAPAWHLFVVAHPRVESLEAALAGAGIGAKPYYRTPVHRQQAMRAWAPAAELPGTEEAARTHLAIPMNSLLTEQQVGEVIAAARAAVAA
jgi:dTDP-4-amino-4,6-dideoxygalactose transaminase